MNQEILRSCIKGDRKAQRYLYDTYSKALYVICLRYARDRQEAQDMLQEGFIKVFQDLAQFDDKRGALWSWMKRVVINACLQYLRKRKDLNFETADFLDVTHPGEEDEAIYPEMDTKILLNYLQRLPDGYRKVFNLHIMEGYSHREIAEYLGISLNTSKSQLSKAKSYLRNWIKEQSLKANISPKLAVVK